MNVIRIFWLVAALVAALGGLSCSSSANKCDSGVACGNNLSCDPDDGLCKCGGRGGTVCGEGLSCDLSSLSCASDLCPASKSCAAGSSCDPADGVCKCGGPGGVTCGEGQVCNPDLSRCVAAVSCTEVACPDNQTCDAATGQCRCGAESCAPGQRCEAIGDGGRSCVADLCAGRTCLGTTQCDPADGVCKCGGSMCGPGEACGCVGGAGQSCEAGERTCAPSSLCDDKVCTGMTTCDPVDGQCKCGGPGGPACGTDQICNLGSKQCQGGSQCTLPDGSAKVCPSGLSCDPETGRCACGGLGGRECRPSSGLDAGEVCVTNFLQTACLPRCDPTSSTCAAPTFCFFDPTSEAKVSYCSVPTSNRTEGQTCSAPTDCYVETPAPTSLHCSGIKPDEPGYCRAYCNPLSGDADCPQFPNATKCEQVPDAPATVGVCVARVN